MAITVFGIRHLFRLVDIFLPVCSCSRTPGPKVQKKYRRPRLCSHHCEFGRRRDNLLNTETERKKLKSRDVPQALKQNMQIILLEFADAGQVAEGPHKWFANDLGLFSHILKHETTSRKTHL